MPWCISCRNEGNFFNNKSGNGRIWKLLWVKRGYLKESDREFQVYLCGHPQSEGIVYVLCLCDLVHYLLEVGEGQVTVLKQYPATLRETLLHKAAGMNFLSLTHGDGSTLWNQKDSSE